MTKTIRVPSPAAGTGYRVIRGRDGRMTTVPLTSSDVTMYRPLLAMDAAMSAGGPVDKFANYNSNLQLPDGSGDDDPDDVNPAGHDTEDQVRQLLEGKLDPADLDALCNLIFPDDAPAPAPAAQDRGRRQARDQKLTMPSRATMEKLVAQGAARRADRAQKQYADLCQRFPALKSARVV